MELVDATVIEQVLGGDSDAFRLLVDRHTRPLYRLAYRITRNANDADDVVQETFLRAYRHLGSFDARSSFGTWLYRIATNVGLDLLRRRRGNEETELDTEAEQQPQVGAHDVLDRLSLSQALDHGMQNLTGRERTAFVLRHYEGMSIAEIGEVLGTETNATKNTIFRAVRKLRQVLEPLIRTPGAIGQVTTS
jgi:RNA polymerase sigma-70 factor (ECF subfamily)